MKSRQIRFYVDLSDLPRMTESFSEEVLPAFRRVPNFLGVTLLRADAGERAEIIASSFWSDGLADSEEVSATVVNDIFRATGENPSRKNFDILYARVEETPPSPRR
ncbi:MAG: hypothetical protein ABSC41_09215 [Acidimicrobiales bacterium]|jgi:hypothetical protein